MIGAMVFCGCGTPQGHEERVGTSADTSGSMPSPEIGNDSIVNKVLVPVENDVYTLYLTSYSMVNGLEKDRAFRIRFDYKQYQLDTLITKMIFADTLGSSWIERAVLRQCTFDAVRSSSLHFSAMVDDTESTASYMVRFSVFYRGPKFGVIYYSITSVEG